MKHNKIKELFENRGMSVAEVSILTGISIGSLYSLTNLRTSPQAKYLSAIEYALRLQPGEIQKAYSDAKEARLKELEKKRSKIATK